MATLFCENNLFLISHKQYINRIYELCANVHNERYILCDTIFEINAKYSKRQFNNRSDDICEQDVTVRKRKRRKSFKIQINPSATFQITSSMQEKFKNFIKKCLKLGHISSSNDRSNVINDNSAALHFATRIQNSNLHLPTLNGENNTAELITTKINNGNFLIPPFCKFYNNDVKNIKTFLPMENQFNLIILDPPWRNKYIKRVKTANESSGYAMLSNEDIGNIPVGELIAKNGIVLIWSTNNQTHIDAIENIFIPKWNLKLITRWYWMKITRYGDPICDFNDPPRKQPYEQIFIACPLNREDELIEKIPKNAVIASVPSVIHSHKPPLLDLLVNSIPSQPKCLEIFARYLLPNFTSVGLEVLRLQHESLYEKTTKD